jgi:hypothetical protein
MLYGAKVRPPILGLITSILLVTEANWNMIINVSSSVQELRNALEQVQRGNELGAYLTKGRIPPKRAVAAVLLHCHIGYSTAIPVTDLAEDIIPQQVVWQTLTKQCAYPMKSETHVELANWLLAQVTKHKHDTNLAESSARANT